MPVKKCRTIPRQGPHLGNFKVICLVVETVPHRVVPLDRDRRAGV
jgi:hypothetical protein